MPDFDRVSEIVAAALEIEAGRRHAFVEAECGSDAALRAEVESLLAAHARAGDFLDTPAPVAAGLVAPEAPLAPGTALGPYRVERELGRGGMGIVYLGEDTRLGRKVAIKALAPEFTRDERRRARLRLEARAAAALVHPGIATVFALEEIDGLLCLVGEYVPGRTLRAEVERGEIPPAELLDIGIQVARALGAAHAAGIVHRDLKPENVIRTGSGLVKVLDFGVARSSSALPPGAERLTQAGAIPGTPAYMSPEQLAGADVDARSDIFSLGVLLFELASGRHPFQTTTPAATAARVIAAEPPSLCGINPGVPVGLEEVVARCLRKDPAERYQSALEVAADLEALRTPQAQAAGRARGRPGPTPGPARVTARAWWVLHQAAVMLVAAAVVWPAWLVSDTVKSPWTTGLLLGIVAVAAVNGTIRAHLLFTSAFNPAEIDTQLRRAGAWLRLSDGLFAAELLAASLPAATSRTALSAVLAAVALGWMVTSLLIEPATRRAAFPASGPGPNSGPGSNRA